MDNNPSQSNYTELLSIIDSPEISQEELLSVLASLIDLSFDLRKIEGLLKALTVIETVDLQKLSSTQRSVFYYYAANANNNKYDLERKADDTDTNKWEFEPEDLKKTVRYLRLSIKEAGFDDLDNNAKCLIYTNLANVLDTLGRFIEAMEYWDRALEINPVFGMALGNAGIGRMNYAKFIYDAGHSGIFIRDARLKFISAVETLADSNQYYSGYMSYQNHLNNLEKIIPEPKDHTCITKKVSLGRSQAEQKYRRWCLRNKLFLNPLNDLGPYPIAAQDILTTPGMVMPLDFGPSFQGLYNQLKQEFISIRYLCYKGICLSDTHFSDRKVLLFNTLDYPVYSLAIEEVKIAFRIGFSLFDKIAYFLNEYLMLNIEKKRVNYSVIWKDKKIIRPQIRDMKNPPLRGLYWLSMDLANPEDDDDYQDCLEPDAINLRDIRNHLEHKYLKVHDILLTYPENSMFTGLKDDLAYSIERSDFERKTIRLLKLVRNALIYLSLAIHVEEIHRNNKRDPSEKLVPMINDFWDDKWKR